MHQRDHRALCDHTAVHADRPRPQEHDKRDIDDDIRHRVHRRGDLPHENLRVEQQLILPLKAGSLCLLIAESPDHARACKVLARPAKDLVQCRLHFLVERYARDHDAEHDNGEQRDRHHEDERGFHVHGKCHDHRSEHDERRAQQQAQREIDTVLQLVHIAGHARDQRAGADRVKFRVGQTLNVRKQRRAQLRGKPDSRLRAEILRRHCADEPHRRKEHEYQPHFDDLGGVIVRDAAVDDGRHDKRHHQLEGSLEHLEQRCQNAFFPVVFYVL